MRRNRLAEDRLRGIVAGAVRNVLREGKLGTAYENLEQARDLLSDIMDSGFIPFSSPHPSSTEEKLKDAIIDAARLIDKSLYLCGKLGYNRPIAHVV